MGGTTFITVGKGSTVQEAFMDAKHQAAYEHGHGGYTGTIAEKSSFVMVTSETLDQNMALALANQLIDQGDKRIDDKWGPAGAIKLSDGYLFFGWASC